MATCPNHPERDASRTCTGCSGVFCDACVVTFEKLLLCASCKARFLAGVDEGPRPASRPGAPPRVTRERRAVSGERGRPVHWFLGCASLFFAGVFAIVIIATIAEPWQAFSDDRKTVDAIDGLVQVGAALERYRADKGEFPKRLDELVPTYLKEIPEDPYGGREPRYAGGRVWSLGPDRDDDGGEQPDDLVYSLGDAG